MPILTRRELYDLVWSKPISRLAEELGLSDVGLTKICERHRVPTPPRGYWAKQQAGKKVKQTIFVHVNDPALDRVEIGAARDRMPGPARDVLDQQRVRRSQNQKPNSRRTICRPEHGFVSEPHPAIRETAATLRQSAGKRSDTIRAIGPGLCGISISSQNIERLIFVLDQLARACEVRGIVVSPSKDRMSAMIAQDCVTFVIVEKFANIPHVMTQAEIAREEERRKRNQRWARGNYDWTDRDSYAPRPPEFDRVGTGELGLEVHGWGGDIRRSWRDGKTQSLETLIGSIVDGLEAHIVATRVWREKREKDEAIRRELDRRRALSKARREREKARLSLLNQLLRTERRAIQLREWIGALKPAHDDPDLARMLTWAKGQLATLESILNPAHLAAHLRSQRLFPDIDDLDDPLGEPPAERIW
jgi:hypothetical protein